MVDYRKEREIILNYLSDSGLKEFVVNNLVSSLESIGFSQLLIQTLTNDLANLNIENFQEKFKEELDTIYKKGFFQKIVPDYFEKYVIPEIPTCESLLDIGCGTGILINRLSGLEKVVKLTGIDINEYPEWKLFRKDNVIFKIVRESEFNDFLNSYQPDVITLTWTLHHMEYSEQEKYLMDIVSRIKNGSTIIILEDSYSIHKIPEKGRKLSDLFMQLDSEKRKKVMSIYDWVANRILAQRKYIPIPFTYRTLGEWQKLGEKIGLHLIKEKYIGFPSQRDINTPQSLLVFKK